MTSRVRWILFGGVLLIGATVVISHMQSWMPKPAPSRVMLSHRVVQPQLEAPAPPFSSDEVLKFLAEAKQAEVIADPMRRCLAYPDPPGSHWSREAVESYCRYRFQKLVSFAEVKKLVQSSRVAELDRRMADALQAQHTRPESRGLLDRTYSADFSDPSEDVRTILDAWKRQSPKSPFALAASGMSYVEMAQYARGDAFIQDTSEDKIESMERLLARAKYDLDAAVTIDSRVTPAYTMMIYSAGLEGSEHYAVDAAKRGLTADPNNYAIYEQLMWLAQPKWGGSLDNMTRIGDMARAHAKNNPLLLLLLPEAPAMAANLNDCDCSNQAALTAYKSVLDQVGGTKLLAAAGQALNTGNHPEMAMIYLSETLRFTPDLVSARATRIFNLTNLGETQWALAEGNHLVATVPKNENSFDARGYVYNAQGDYVNAEKDFRRALTINPKDTWTLATLGRIYADSTHEWDKAWDIANQLIQDKPDDPSGWMLRANIQKNQPRQGLNETITSFNARFINDPNHQQEVVQMLMLEQSASK